MKHLLLVAILYGVLATPVLGASRVTAVPDSREVTTGESLKIEMKPCSSDCGLGSADPETLRSLEDVQVEDSRRNILWAGAVSEDLMVGPVLLESASQRSETMVLLITVPVSDFRMITGGDPNEFVTVRGYAPIAEIQVSVNPDPPERAWTNWLLAILALAIAVTSILVRNRVTRRSTKEI